MPVSSNIVHGCAKMLLLTGMQSRDKVFSFASHNRYQVKKANQNIANTDLEAALSVENSCMQLNHRDFKPPTYSSMVMILKNFVFTDVILPQGNPLMGSLFMDFLLELDITG